MSCDLMGIVGTFTDIVKGLKVSGKALLTDVPTQQEIAVKTEQVSGFRRFSVSIMAADRIMTDVVNMKTAKSRRDAFEKSVVHVYLFVLFVLAGWGLVCCRAFSGFLCLCVCTSYARFQVEMKTLGIMEMPSVVKAWWLAEINSGKQ